MLVSLWIDRYYDRHLLRYFLWTVWYPLAFWMISMVTTVIALPKALRTNFGLESSRAPDGSIRIFPKH